MFGVCLCLLPPYQEFMEAAFGRLHNSGAGAFGARPTVVDSIILDREAASIGIPKTYTQSELLPDQGRVF